MRELRGGHADPVPLLGGILRLITFPLGQSYAKPTDHVGRKVARLLLTENASRDRLTDGVYISDANDAEARAAEQPLVTAQHRRIVIDDENLEPLV